MYCSSHKLIVQVCLVAIGIFFMAAETRAQWVSQNSETNRTLRSVSFINARSGWAAGDSGIILHSVDGGTHWIRQQTPVIAPLMSVSFCDELNGWAAGEAGTLLKTSDAGASWVQVKKDTGRNVQHFKVQCLSPSVAIVLRDSFETDYYTNHRIWKTLDGGASWTEISPRKNFYRALNDIHFISPSIGWACGFGGPGMDGYQIHRTTDGGATWSTCYFRAPTYWSVRKIYFKDATEGWAFTDSLYHSTDGGQTWTGIGVPPVGDPNNVVMFGQIGYASEMTGKVIKTIDGGFTWTNRSPASPGLVFGMSFISPEAGWLTGYSGRILHTDNGIDGMGVQSYYPLSLGNQWSYTAPVWATPVTVVGDSLFTNGYRYRVLDKNDFAGGNFVRVDSHYVYYYDRGNDRDVPFFKLDGTIGETTEFGKLCNGFSRSHILAIDTMTVFGVNTRYIRYRLDEITQRDITLTEKFGLVRAEMYADPPPPWPNVVYTVSGCSIAGRKYGLTSSVATGATTVSPFALSQNYPNPFNPLTTISFSLPSRSFVSLKIYDVMGRDVATLVSEDLSAGTYQRTWNASSMPSAVYFFRLQVGAYSETKRLLLMR